MNERVSAFVVVPRLQKPTHLLFAVGEMKPEAGCFLDRDCFSQLGCCFRPLACLAKLTGLAEQTSRNGDVCAGRISACADREEQDREHCLRTYDPSDRSRACRARPS